MPARNQSRSRLIVYWVTTLLVAAEMTLGGIWDLLRTQYVRAIMDHLGYPGYLLTILGVWKLLGTAAILMPRFPRLREWAYAGMFFLYSGAVASHFFMGDGPARWAGPLVFCGFLMVSWRLLPAPWALRDPAGARAVTPARPHPSAL
ncbi:MAG TPA: DoxX family protein [Acidobacteriaceae bacterium]|nr:DoxX family protein [Acidobacteriaceae bacterium]